MRRRVAVPLALLLLAALLLAVGPRAVAAELAAADPRPLAVGAAGSLAALLSWSEAQRRLHRAAGASVPPLAFARGYLVGVFGKQVVPGGQLAGPAVVAYGLGRETPLTYEEDLAAATVGKLLGTLAAVAPAAAGLVAVAVPPRVARPAAAALALAAAGVLGGTAVVSLRADDAAALLRWVGHALHRTVGRVSARVERRTAPDAVAGVVERGRHTLSVVGGDRRGLAAAYLLTALGWGLYAVALWGAANAVGVPLTPGLALVAAPVASLGTTVPLPSGVGGVELVLGSLLVAAVGAGVASAAAVVLLFRVLVDLLPAVTGALAGLTRGDGP